MENNDKEFQEGFNSGYLFSKHEPALAAAIIESVKGQSQNQYFSGFSTGHDTFANEKLQSPTVEQLTPEKKNPKDLFMTGFNSGYILTKYAPELSNKLITTQANPSDYHKGLSSGKQEFQMEKTRERLKGMSQNNPSVKKIEKNKGKER
jgi:hypothetical protein